MELMGSANIEGKVAKGSDEGVGKRASFKSDKIRTIAPWSFAKLRLHRTFKKLATKSRLEQNENNY